VEFDLLPRRGHIGTAAMRNLRRHTNTLTQRRVRVNGLTDVHRIGAHLNGQCDLANHVARMRTNDSAAQNLAVAVGIF
jgi:hypothetical protein